MKQNIVAITEPWQVPSELCNVDTYSVFTYFRQARRDGGVLLWCRDTLRPSLLSVNVSDLLETVWIKIYPANHPC